MSRLLSFFLLLTLLGSCASQKRITLNDKGFIPLKDYAKVSTLTTNGFSILVGEVQDLREKKDSVGLTYTGMLDEVTPLDFSSSAEGFVANQLSAGLAKRGISTSSAAPFTLKTKIEKLWLEESTTGLGPRVMECEAKLAFELWEEGKTKPRWFGSFWAKASSGSQVDYGVEKKEATYASCINELLEQFVHDKNFLKVTGAKLKK